MPFIHRDGARLYWRADGDRANPSLLLANSLGTDHALWEPVMAQLIERFHVLRFDMRGHGASEAPAGPYTIEALAGDVLAVADAAQVQRFSFAGISIGGMIGQWLGAHAAERIDRLVLSNTTSRSNPDAWNTRIQAVEAGGMAAIAESVLARWFTPPFLARNPPRVAGVRTTLLACDLAGYLGCCAAIRDMDLTPSVGTITVPTLVITGTEDLAIPPAQGQAIAQLVAGSRLVELPAAHIPVIERPGLFVDALLSFLTGDRVATERERYEAGMARRRSVLGNAYVDARQKGVNSFNAEYQDMITRHAWGEIWTRHVLDDRTRRLLVIAMMLSLDRFDEFQMHVRSGMDAELSLDELKEVLPIAAIYAGVPVANTGFHKAAEVPKERGA